MTKLENYTKYIMAALTGSIVAALYSPIVLTIFYSFYKTRKGKVDWNSFSYEPYTKLIFEKQILESLMNSILENISDNAKIILRSTITNETIDKILELDSTNKDAINLKKNNILKVKRELKKELTN